MLWHSCGDDFHLEKGYWPDFQEVIEAGYSEGRPRPMKKINLPSAKANQLLRLLFKSRLSKAHLMPTYDNIAKTVKDTYFIKALEQSLKRVIE